MEQSLLNSYRETTYSVPKLDINIQLNKKNIKLQQFLETSSYSSWAFITAWNPNSTLLTDHENERRNESLSNKLKNFDYYDGIGIPDEDDWKPEESFFVVDVSKGKADMLADEYGQNAYLFGTKGTAAELVIMND